MHFGKGLHTSAKKKLLLINIDYFVVNGLLD